MIGHDLRRLQRVATVEADGEVEWSLTSWLQDQAGVIQSSRALEAEADTRVRVPLQFSDVIEQALAQERLARTGGWHCCHIDAKSRVPRWYSTRGKLLAS